MKKCTLLVISIFTAMMVMAQATSYNYNLVIKGGRVIDPRNNINSDMDIAIKDGKIAEGCQRYSRCGSPAGG